MSARLAQSAVLAGIVITLVLIAAKLAAWLLTGSVAMLGALLDSTVDLAASALAFFAMRLAARPADRGHRFGHGKAEPLAAFAQSGFLFASAVAIVLEAVQRAVSPQPVTGHAVGLAVAGLSVVLTVGLTQWQRYVVRRTGSMIVAADSTHYAADTLIGIAVLISLTLDLWLPGLPVDALLGLVVAGLLARGAVAIAREALDVLMDRELPEEERQRIRDTLAAVPECQGMHDLRTRSAGGQRFIEFHMELDGAMTLSDAHDIADRVEADLRAIWRDADITIHQEPAGLEDERLDNRLRRRRE